ELVANYKGVTLIDDVDRKTRQTKLDEFGRPKKKQKGQSALYTAYGVRKQLLDDLYIRALRRGAHRYSRRLPHCLVHFEFLLSLLDGASREEAATIGGMDRQTLRDWVIRFNEQGPDGLINIPSPGVPPKLNSRHKAFLARIVDEGPIPAIHGVVRWRACDLI